MDKNIDMLSGCELSWLFITKVGNLKYSCACVVVTWLRLLFFFFLEKLRIVHPNILCLIQGFKQEI